jgi:hypothetical protein
MADRQSQTANDFLTPQEMQQWLNQELRDVAKSTELRTTQAAHFVTDYAMGKITPEQADNQLQDYRNRWPEALPGANVGVEKSDAEILKRVDTASGATPTHLVREIYRRRMAGTEPQKF